MFRQKRVPLPRVPSDEVVAAQWLDDTLAIRGIVMGIGMRFNQRLDCDKIHHALASMLEIDEWRKLGGRLRLDAKGYLQIHIPREFTPDRPAVRYSHADHSDVNIDDHPLGSRLPSPADEFKPDRALTTFDDYLCTDHPQFSLHAVSFRDATFVSLKWCHTTTDAMGYHALFTNWSRVLAGCEHEVQPLGGFDRDRDDVVRKIADLDPDPTTNPAAHEVAGRRALSGLSFILFVVRLIWALLFGPKMIWKVFVIPAKTAQALKDEVDLDLLRGAAMSMTGKRRGEPSPFVSDGDILNAWAARIALSDQPPNSTREVAMMNIVDMRGRVPAVFGAHQPSAAGPVWVQNLVVPAWTHLDVKSLLGDPVAHTALKLRAALLEQATPESFARTVRYLISRPSSKRFTLFSKPTGHLFAFSNWHRTKMFDFLDFGPAIIAPETDQKSEKGGGKGYGWPEETQPGKPVCIVPSSFPNTGQMRNMFSIVGKDVAGNYWMHGIVSQACWDNLEKEVSRLAAAAKKND